MKTLLCGLLALAAMTAAGPGVAAPGQIVRTSGGEVAGTDQGAANAYLGIPYAAAPVGERRWRPPQPAAAWSGVLRADHFGASCPQPTLPMMPARPDAPPKSEDCLFLNVWTPKAAAPGKTPVMVWIHGGAYQFGSGDLVGDGPGQFTKDGVILVSMNYRLGRLGQFAHPALTAEAPNGPLANYGLMDVIAALTWVKRNIQAFGGDPDKVTIFGISSGGGMVNLLTISPVGAGLFHKAIAESANGFPAWSYLDRGDGLGGPSAEAVGRAWAQSVGATTAAELRALPVEVTNRPQIPMPRGGPVLIVDGKLVPERVTDAYAAGRQHAAAYLTGTVSLEGTLVQAFPMPLAHLYGLLGDQTGAAKALYDPDGKQPEPLQAMQLYGDIGFGAPARNLARLNARAGRPTWMYYFDYVPEQLRGTMPGAGHGGEYGFIFDSFAGVPGPHFTPTEADRAMAAKVHAYWVNFAKTGDPNGPGLPPWPRFTPSAQVSQTFSAAGIAPAAEVNKTRLDVVEAAALVGPTDR